MNAELLDWGRFTEPALFILVSLASGPKHGYAMMEDVEDFAGVRLGAGTLYGAIARLEERGWVEALPFDERRRPYRLTLVGAAMLDARLTRLDTCVALGRQRLAAS